MTRLHRYAFALVALLWLGGAQALERGRPPEAAVATQNAQATDAGLEILAQGGNAFDAAVAVSATLGLVEPESSGLGGGGFLLLHLAKGERDVFIDAREKAPLAATRNMYLDAKGEPDRKQTTIGARAAAIPGMPAGIVYLQKKYGRLPLSKSFAPAIRLAENGWTFSLKNVTLMGYRKDQLRADPGAAALYVRDGELPVQGAVLKNPAYADVLRKIAKEGADGFYRGELAKQLVDGVTALGGNWTLADLEQYRVVEREPLRFQYRDWTLVTAPPPSSGGPALVEIFHILEGYELAKMSRVGQVHLMVEAMRRAYRDRAIYLGDPDFVKIPLDLMTSPQYAAGLRASINPRKATPSELLPGVELTSEGNDTSHFSIIDKEGNVAAITQSSNLPYGACVSVPGTGFMLNDEMDDFSVKPGVPNAYGLVGDDANAIAPGKRPLSSMAPTILIGKDRVAALGSPGGSRIISTVLLGLMQLMDGKSAADVAAAPRIHHQYLPDKVAYEPGALSEDEIAQLKARGFTLAEERAWSNLSLIVWDVSQQRVEAASDPRWKGVGKGSVGKEAIYQ